jgi:hypothetical protein
MIMSREDQASRPEWSFHSPAGEEGKGKYKALCEVFDSKAMPDHIETVAAP